jgi:sialic acid synthase
MFDIEYKKPCIVAEIGCNHMGKEAIALELIKIAKEQGADYAKFQKRNVSELLSEEQFYAPHPEMHHAFAYTYGEHRQYLEFSIDQHAKLKNFCEENGIAYACSVWDISSAREIIGLNPDYIKVPSACNNNLELLKVLRDEYTGDVHISMGMTTREEESAIIEVFSNNKNSSGRLILYACTSAYPVPDEDMYLLEIQRLFRKYSGQIKEVGFSGHHNGISLDIAAYTLGATWFERHFTKDRTWKGTDQAASLEPIGLFKVIRDLHGAYNALKYKTQEIADIEKPYRMKLKSRTHA